MAETETGWTKEWPTVDGVYWYRLDSASVADVVEVCRGDVYYAGDGVGVSVRNHDGGEWLGPISPSDAEQLIELRTLLRDIQAVLLGPDGPNGSDLFALPITIEERIRVLTPKQKEKERE